MAEWLIRLVMVAELVLVGGLVVLGGRRLRRHTRMRAGEGATWPALSVVVPLTGTSGGIYENLGAILGQDYPDYEVLLVTATAEEPAAAAVRRAMAGERAAGCASCRHVISGAAEMCSQKNHSLLAGVAQARSSSEVLVFADADHLAGADWLRTLVVPMAAGEAGVTTGYHHVILGDRQLPTIVRAVAVLHLYLMQQMPRLTQPWGGNTATRRRLFDDLKVVDLWGSSVVDDVTLAARLRQAQVQVTAVPDAVLLTPWRNETFATLERWLVRQLLYLKFVFPGSWAAGGAVALVMAGVVLFSAMRCAFALVRLVSASEAVWPFVFLLVLSGLMLAARRLHPEPGRRMRWVAASYAGLFMSAWCHVRTWFAREVSWRGMRYRVTWGGRVIGIRGK